MTRRWVTSRSTLTAVCVFSACALGLAGTDSAAQAAGYPVGGKILEEYNQAAAANGQTPAQYFGDAITRELDAARGGKYQKFYRNNSIYWHPLVSNGHANQIGGSIRDKWLEPINGNAAEWGPLRYPTTREKPTRKPGRFNHFEGGSIYWSASTGAHRIWGKIRDTWAAADWENGMYGFPTTDEFSCAANEDVPDNSPDADDYGGFGQRFENGWIVWGTGSFTMKDEAAVVGDELPYAVDEPFQYSSQLDNARTTWNALGSIDLYRIDDDEHAPLVLHTTDEPSEDWAGYYEETSPGYQDIFINEPAIYNPNVARNVIAHEMGHALGLDHSCQGQLMDPFENDYVFTPQYMDVKAYRDNWG